MKKILLILIVALFSQWSKSQETSLTYKVTNFSINGVNYDHLALENDVALSFYYCDSNTLCFANHWRNSNSQSYGGVYSLITKESPETDTNYEIKEIRFTWQFVNTYDSDRGEAIVTIKNIYIGSIVKFIAEIVVLNTNEIIEMKGYLE